jgi:hypothetical protein
MTKECAYLGDFLLKILLTCSLFEGAKLFVIENAWYLA